MNSAIEFSIADFPGYAEAVARETHVRNTACLGINEVICGLEVRPLTASHVRLLSLIRSPFIHRFSAEQLCAKPDIIADIMRFLWLVSPHFKQGSFARKHWWQRRTARDRFNSDFAPIMKQRLDVVVREILDYVEDSFIDAEEGDAGKSYFSEDVAIAYELSKFHGYRLDFWHSACPADRNPLQVPLKIVFQLRKVRKSFEHGTDGLANRSDALVQAGLKMIGLLEVNRRRFADPAGVNNIYGVN